MLLIFTSRICECFFIFEESENIFTTISVQEGVSGSVIIQVKKKLLVELSKNPKFDDNILDAFFNVRKGTWIDFCRTLKI